MTPEVPPPAPDVGASADPAEERLLARLDGLGVFLAGPANVVMQLAWPEVGYGVAESRVDSGSIYRHPFKRFRTTVGYVGIALWGSDELRVAFREAVNGQHRQVRSGPDSPVAYNAFNRDLQLWVASCLYHGLRDLVVSMHGPITDEDEEVLLRIGARFGTTLQVPSEMWHVDRAAFEDYWARGLERVRIDEPVRAYLLGVLLQEILPFPLDRLARPVLGWCNLGFLPDEFRDAMGLEWTAADRRRHARLVRLMGRGQELLPKVVRRFPVNLMVANINVRRRLGRPLV